MGLGTGVGTALPDYYKVLGVRRTASLIEIVAAFRNLAFQVHPDTNPNEPPSGEKFIKVNAAYEVLSVPEKRAAYDLRLASSAFSNVAAGVRPQQQTRPNGWEAQNGTRAWDATSTGTRRNSEWIKVDKSLEVYDGTTISVVTSGGGYLKLGYGRGKEVRFNGALFGFKANDSKVMIDSKLGELTLPEGLDVVLQLQMRTGSLEGRIVHGGNIWADLTTVNLELAGDIGAILNLNAVDLLVTGYGSKRVKEFVNQGSRTFTPPFSPHSERMLNIESEMNSVKLSYRQ